MRLIIFSKNSLGIENFVNKFDKICPLAIKVFVLHIQFVFPVIGSKIPKNK